MAPAAGRERVEGAAELDGAGAEQAAGAAAAGPQRHRPITRQLSDQFLSLALSIRDDLHLSGTILEGIIEV